MNQFGSVSNQKWGTRRCVKRVLSLRMCAYHSLMFQFEIVLLPKMLKGSDSHAVSRCITTVYRQNNAPGAVQRTREVSPELEPVRWMRLSFSLCVLELTVMEMSKSMISDYLKYCKGSQFALTLDQLFGRLVLYLYVIGHIKLDSKNILLSTFLNPMREFWTSTPPKFGCRPTSLRCWRLLVMRQWHPFLLVCAGSRFVRLNISSCRCSSSRCGYRARSRLLLRCLSTRVCAANTNSLYCAQMLPTSVKVTRSICWLQLCVLWWVIEFRWVGRTSGSSDLRR